VNKGTQGRLESKSPLQPDAVAVARPRLDVQWTRAYHNPKALDQIIKGLDALFAAYRQNPKLAQAEPSTWNPTGLVWACAVKSSRCGDLNWESRL